MNRTGRIALLIALALALPVAAAAQDDGDKVYKEFKKTVALDAGGRLSFKTFKGSIELKPWDREEVEIIAHIVADPELDEDYARVSVDATVVEVRGSGSTVRIKSNYEDVPCEENYSLLGRLFGGCTKTLPFVHYEIRAPRRIRLRIDDYKSTIEIARFEGEFDIETYKGIFNGDNLTGELTLDTYKGQVRLAGLEGSFDIETYKGDIEVGLSGMSARSSIETYKGLVVLKLERKIGFDIRADLGRRAEFQAEFPLRVRTGRGNSLAGSVNGGGPVLSVQSYKGQIRIEERP